MTESPQQTFVFVHPQDGSILWFMSRMSREQYVLYSYEGVLLLDTEGNPVLLCAKGIFLSYCVIETTLWIVFSKTIVRVSFDPTPVPVYVNPKRFETLLFARWNSSCQEWVFVQKDSKVVCCGVQDNELHVLRKYQPCMIPMGVTNRCIYGIRDDEKLVTFDYQRKAWSIHSHRFFPTDFKSLVREMLLCWHRMDTLPRDMQYEIIRKLAFERYQPCIKKIKK